MNKNFKSNERELVKVANFFKRQSKKLIYEGALSEEYNSVQEAVDRFVEQMEYHANSRAFLLEQREYLQKLVKDNAECPRCHTKDMIKLAGTEKNEKGWTSNRYKCRKCNIQFTWNRPNNPWDMIHYIEEVLLTLRMKYAGTALNTPEQEQSAVTLEGMQATLDKLKPVIDAHDKEYDQFQAREREMDKLIHEFKNNLLIEKIKMDTWESRNRQ